MHVGAYSRATEVVHVVSKWRKCICVHVGACSRATEVVYK